MKRIICVLMTCVLLLFTACSNSNPAPSERVTIPPIRQVTKEMARSVAHGMSLGRVQDMLGSGVDIASGSVILKYELSDGDVAIFGFTMDEESVFRVSSIYIGEPQSE